MPVRPRDAAGLVLLRGALESPEVMLGRRHRKARFMPGVFVTPGGGLDGADHRPSGFPEALPAPPDGLDARTRDRLAAFARCALRETLEETGHLVIGNAAAAPPEAAAPPWRAYARLGRGGPAFDALYLFARAITPASSPIRFHTRFFLGLAPQVAQTANGDGELEEVQWVPWPELPSLPMSEVTRAVLAAAYRHAIAVTEGRPRRAERMVYRRGQRLFSRRNGAA